MSACRPELPAAGDERLHRGQVRRRQLIKLTMGCARLIVRLTRSTSLGLSKRSQRPHERSGRRLLTPGLRSAQDSAYLRAVSRLTALAREAQSA